MYTHARARTLKSTTSGVYNKRAKDDLAHKAGAATTTRRIGYFIGALTGRVIVL